MAHISCESVQRYNPFPWCDSSRLECDVQPRVVRLLRRSWARRKRGCLSLSMKTFQDYDRITHDTLEEELGNIEHTKKEPNSPIIRPPVYHTVKSTLVKAIRPYLPHYREAIRHQVLEYILAHVLSPTLQTMHPGIGSTVTQIPSSIPS